MEDKQKNKWEIALLVINTIITVIVTGAVFYQNKLISDANQIQRDREINQKEKEINWDIIKYAHETLYVKLDTPEGVKKQRALVGLLVSQAEDASLSMKHFIWVIVATASGKEDYNAPKDPKDLFKNIQVLSQEYYKSINNNLDFGWYKFKIDILYPENSRSKCSKKATELLAFLKLKTGTNIAKDSRTKTSNFNKGTSQIFYQSKPVEEEPGAAKELQRLLNEKKVKVKLTEEGEKEAKFSKTGQQLITIALSPKDCQ